MKQQIKNLIICLPLVGSWFAYGAPYDDDPQDFYVEGQSINSSLAQANAIICYMSNMRPDQLVNDGNYKAIVYKDDCETSKKAATSEAASATATSSPSRRPSRPPTCTTPSATAWVASSRWASPRPSRAWPGCWYTPRFR